MRELVDFFNKPGEFCEKLGDFTLAHKYETERNSLSSLYPELGEGKQTH